MNYIVLDLEWNQCPDGKARSNPRLPFEIIEIGAVKLDDDLHIIDTFHEIITPQVYRRLHRMTRSVVHLTDHDLKGHPSFPVTAERFLHWCGETYGTDYLFCTYGPSDLPELQRNLDFYKVRAHFPFPLLYLDIQKLFGMAQEGHKSSRSLEYAVEHLHIPEDRPFHDALCDAHYASQVFVRLPLALISTYYSVDYYRIPRKAGEELYLTYPTYSKYVSRSFPDRESALHDRSAATCTCSICGRRCRKKILWFPSGTKNYLSIGICPDHGSFQSKLRIKGRPDGQVFVVRTQRQITDDEAASVQSRALAYRQKKKEKKRKTNQRS